MIPGGSVTLNQPLLIEDSTAFTVLQASGSYQVVPGTLLLDYIFTWKTTTWATDSLDIVEVEGTGGCSLSLTTLTPASQGVEHAVTLESGEFIHELIWRDQLCTAGCDLQFRVKSEIDGQFSDWSDYRNFSVSVCGKKYVPQN